MYRLLIKKDDEYKELIISEEGGLILQASEPLEYKFGKAHKTYTITIPNFGENNYYLDNLFNKQFEYNVVYNDVYLGIENNIWLKGVLKVNSFDRKEAKCQFVSEYTTLLEELKSTKLNELDYGIEIEHTKDNIIDSQDGSTYHNGDIIFDFIDRGKTRAYKENDESGMDCAERFPAIRLKKIIDTIFEDYNIEGNFLENEFYEKLYLPFIFKNKNITNELDFQDENKTKVTLEKLKEEQYLQIGLTNFSKVYNKTSDPSLDFIIDYDISDSWDNDNNVFEVPEDGVYNISFLMEANAHITRRICDNNNSLIKIKILDNDNNVITEKTETHIITEFFWDGNTPDNYEDDFGFDIKISTGNIYLQSDDKFKFQFEFDIDFWDSPMVPPTWDSTSQYSVNTIIQYNSKGYKAIRKNAVDWEMDDYDPGDRVYHNGQTYEALVETYEEPPHSDWVVPTVPDIDNDWEEIDLGTLEFNVNNCIIEVIPSSGIGENSTYRVEDFIFDEKVSDFIKDFLHLFNLELYINQDKKQVIFHQKEYETNIIDITNRIIENSISITPDNQRNSYLYKFTIDGNDGIMNELYGLEDGINSDYLFNVTGSKETDEIEVNFSQTIIGKAPRYGIGSDLHHDPPLIYTPIVRLWKEYNIDEIEVSGFSTEFNKRLLLFNGLADCNYNLYNFNDTVGLVGQTQSQTITQFPYFDYRYFGTDQFQLQFGIRNNVARDLFNKFHKQTITNKVYGHILECEMILNDDFISSLYYLDPNKDWRNLFSINIPGFSGYYRLFRLERKDDNIYNAKFYKELKEPELEPELSENMYVVNDYIDNYFI